MRALDNLVRAGKILYAGICNTPAWRIAEMQTLADLRGWSPLVALQIEYSLVERTVEHELLPMGEALGLGVLPWSPLGGSVLAGLALIVRSPYLLGLCGYLLLHTAASTFLYFEQGRIVAGAFPDTASRTPRMPRAPWRAARAGQRDSAAQASAAA